VELLTQFFLASVNEREATSKRLSDLALRRLHEMKWPGNVRELKNVIERAAILADSVIGPEMLPEPDASRVIATPKSTLQVRVGSSFADVERRLILATLKEFDGDKKRTAQALGISLKTLYNRLNVYEAAKGSA
jgi:DNA-binding NtrC family response regulator